MQLQHAQLIVESASNLGLEVRLHENYSGRGMYGNRTAGVTGKRGDIVKSIAAAAVDLGRHMQDEPIAESFVEDMDLSWDSMGLDMIAY